VKQAQVLKDNLTLLQVPSSSLDISESPHNQATQDNEATHPFGVEEISCPLSLQDAVDVLPAKEMVTPTEERLGSANDLADRPVPASSMLSPHNTSMWQCAIDSVESMIMSCFGWLQEYEPEAEGPMQKFVHSTMFRSVVSIVIVANAITLGLMTQSHTQAGAEAPA